MPSWMPWRAAADENEKLRRMDAANTQRIARMAARRDELIEELEWERRQRQAAEALAERQQHQLVTAQQTIEFLRDRIDGARDDARLEAIPAFTR